MYAPKLSLSRLIDSAWVAGSTPLFPQVYLSVYCSAVRHSVSGRVCGTRVHAQASWFAAGAPEVC